MPRSRNADALFTQFLYDGTITDELVEAMGTEDLFQPVNEGLDNDEIDFPEEDPLDFEDPEC